jgi:inhibitor of cysteine peptidase
MSARKVLRIEDNGETVVIARGGNIDIILPENPTTGFRWHLEPIASRAVKIKDRYAPGDSGVGGGGERIFVVSALKGGCVRVRLELFRIWETPANPIQRFAVDICIE